jgi:two-component system response regulator (stage 0 sporulation protein A)
MMELTKEQIKEIVTNVTIAVVDVLMYKEIPVKNRVTSYSDRAITAEELVTDKLKGLSIPQHVKGFKYLRSAILMIINGSNTCLTKCIYPALSREYDTMPNRVERAIRHSIEFAHKNGGFGEYRPTNSEIIISLADEIRLDMKREAQG